VYDLAFVPHPDPDTISHNSNRVVAGWLEQLGCRVEGPVLFAVCGWAAVRRKRRDSSSANAAPGFFGRARQHAMAA
jgi:hypothetical protein